MIVLQCENMLDAEHMTWLVINHVTDLIQLSRESPVQDFIRWGRSYQHHLSIILLIIILILCNLHTQVYKHRYCLVDFILVVWWLLKFFCHHFEFSILYSKIVYTIGISMFMEGCVCVKLCTNVLVEFLINI